MSKEKEDYRKVTQPKADQLFSEPNDLAEAIKDLEDFESYTNTDNLYQSTDGDRQIVEKHEPYEDAEKAKIVKKALQEKQPAELKKVEEHRDIFDKDNFDKGLLNDPKEIQDLLESEEAYFKHLDIED